MLKQKEQRLVYYDSDLQLEAYHLSGIVQKFPNHFHDYYVIGFVEGGKRHLWCKNNEYDLSKGDLILFNPQDNHYCAPINQESLDYRALNINTDVMNKAVFEITGQHYTPHFAQSVVFQSDITESLRDLYRLIVDYAPKMEKEEALFFLLEQVLQEYSTPYEDADILEPSTHIKMLCTYMEDHFEDNITLDDLRSKTNFSKSYLLRIFTKQVGISPYRYLQTVRIEKAKKLLINGITPIDVASMTGFVDQSHFTKFFKEFIGLTPKQYQRIFTNTMDAGITKKELHNGKK